MNRSKDRESSGQKYSTYAPFGVKISDGSASNKNQSTIQTMTQPNFTFAEETGTIKGMTTGASATQLPFDQKLKQGDISGSKMTPATRILQKIASIQSRNSIIDEMGETHMTQQPKKFFKKQLTHTVTFKNSANVAQSLTCKKQ